MPINCIPPFKRRLKYGDKGEDVRDLQSRLNNASEFLDDTPRVIQENGKYDYLTKQEVYHFQGQCRLPQTGLYDYNTHVALGRTMNDYINWMSSQQN